MVGTLWAAAAVAGCYGVEDDVTQSLEEMDPALVASLTAQECSDCNDLRPSLIAFPASLAVGDRLHLEFFLPDRPCGDAAISRVVLVATGDGAHGAALLGTTELPVDAWYKCGGSEGVYGGASPTIPDRIAMAPAGDYAVFVVSDDGLVSQPVALRISR